MFTGGSLQISGTIANDGIIDVNDGTIEMKSASAQTIGASVFSGNTIKNIIINNTEGVTLLDPSMFQELSLFKTGIWSQTVILHSCQQNCRQLLSMVLATAI